MKKQQGNEPAALVSVKVRWAKGGELTEGTFDPSAGLIYAKRAARPVIASIHSGVIEWVAPIA